MTDELEQQMMDEMSNESVRRKEESPTWKDDPEWKKRIERAKALAKGLNKALQQPTEPKVEEKPDMGQPQNELEQLVEEDRQFGRKVIDENLEKLDPKEIEKSIDAEALYNENVSTVEMDEYKKERFKDIYISTIQTSCLGKTLDEIDEMLNIRHWAIFDARSGMQAMFAYRKELMKDEDAEKRAQRMKSDKLFKPPKDAVSYKAKAAKEKKPKKSMEELMVDAMRAKGLSEEVIKQRLAKFKGIL